VTARNYDVVTHGAHCIIGFPWCVRGVHLEEDVEDAIHVFFVQAEMIAGFHLPRCLDAPQRETICEWEL